MLLGLASSGLHANGFSLVRQVMRDQGLFLADPAPFAPDQTLASALLIPTRIYVRSLLALFEHEVIKALAHITGGGLLDNLPRVLPQGVVARIDAGSWHAPPVFLWLYEAARMNAEEMLRTFNCGIGMVLVVTRRVCRRRDALPHREGRDRLSPGRAGRRRRPAAGRRSTAWMAEPAGRRAHRGPDLRPRQQPRGADRGTARGPPPAPRSRW